jgi:glycerol-3-phosphate acyltransferase PlsY
MTDAVTFGTAVAVIVGSYLLGGIATGYYLVRWRTGQDLRELGSGSTGGTNAARVLGRSALVAVMVADMLKGALAVWAARYFHLDDWAMALTVAAVVAGHVFPVQLRFHGGRGLSPALGAMLIYDISLAPLVLGLTGLFWLVSRRLTLSVMAGVAAAPLLAFALRRPPAEGWGLVPVALIIVAAHRHKLAAEIASL